MRTLKFFALIVVCFLAAQTLTNAQSAADKTAIEATLREGYAAFAAKDAARFGAVFTEDVDYATPVDFLRGRKAVEASMVEVFKMVKVVKYEISGVNVRFLTADIAAMSFTVDEEDEVMGQTQKGKYLGIFTVVRTNGKWLASTCIMSPVMDMQANGGK